MRTPVIFLLCVFLLAAFGLQAQDNGHINCFSAGIKAGATYGTPLGKIEKVDSETFAAMGFENAGATGRPGFGPVVGFFGRYELHPKWGLQAELYYTHKKAKFSAAIQDQAYAYPYHPTRNPDTTVYIDTKFTGIVAGEFNNHYLEFPLMGYYNLGKNYSFLLGPYVSYLMIAGNTGTANGEVGWGGAEVKDEPFDESVNLSKWDVGVASGVRYDFERFNVEVRATAGFRSVYSPSYTLRSEPVVNLYLQMTAGYKIYSFCKKDIEKNI